MREPGGGVEARLTELARRAQTRDLPQCSRFLTPEEGALALRCAAQAGVEAALDGGWAHAERVQCCFYPPGDAPSFTGVWLRAVWNSRFGQVDHRALLGSVMALGADRSLLGDLVLEEGRAFIRAMPELAARLPGELTRVGSVTVRVAPETALPPLQPPQGLRQRDTVASLRLDGVLSSGLRTSRARAAEQIRQGLVQVDHRPTLRGDMLLQAGAVLSVRGFGRMILREVGAPTQKGRIPIVLEVFARNH